MGRFIGSSYTLQRCTCNKKWTLRIGYMKAKLQINNITKFQYGYKKKYY